MAPMMAKRGSSQPVTRQYPIKVVSGPPQKQWTVMDDGQEEEEEEEEYEPGDEKKEDEEEEEQDEPQGDGEEDDKLEGLMEEAAEVAARAQRLASAHSPFGCRTAQLVHVVLVCGSGPLLW